MTDTHVIQHLIYKPGGVGQDVVVRVRITGFVSRSLGIVPNYVSCDITEPEYDLLPDNLSDADITIRIGTTDSSIDIAGWRIIDVSEGDWGHTHINPAVRPVVFNLTLHDLRWQLIGDRGGVLLDGLLNPTRPDGQIYTAAKVTNSQLMQKCIDVMPLTFIGPIPSTVNDYDPPAELEWYGVHAPTELQRLLEITRHAFALNQDGTYSIVRLLDAHEPLVPPEIDPLLKLPSKPHKLAPNAPGKCLIASCPTRNLIQRSRTLGTLGKQLEWVGVDNDDSIKTLTDLSWWPSGKTPQEVLRNNYIDVAEDKRNLAKASIYKMLKLSDADLTTLGTLVNRLVIDYTMFSMTIKEPLPFRLEAKSIIEDEHGMYVKTTTRHLIENVQFDMATGVIKSGSLLITIDQQRASNPLPRATALAGLDVEFTFGHYPDAGDYTDYFMVPYEWDETLGAVEITSGDPIPDALADPANVPVYRFDSLQAQYIENVMQTGIDPYNIDEMKTIAQKLAKAILVDQSGSDSEVQQFEGIHDAQTDGSVTQVTWDPNNLQTTCHLKHHLKSGSDYAAMIAINRQSRGGVSVAPQQPLTRGAMSGRSGSAGAAMGAHSPDTQSGSVLSGASGGVDGNVLTKHVRTFSAKSNGTPSQIGSNFKWTYPFIEVYKNGTAFGSGKLVSPANAVNGDAANRYEIDNTDAGATGIGVTVEYLAACNMEVKPVALIWLFIDEIYVYKADGTVLTEYWFNEPNPVGEI